MTNRTFTYRWEWPLQSTPEAFWPFISDTNRFNRETGVPSIDERPRVSGASVNARRLRLYRFGVQIEWDEEPFEWVYPHKYGVVRRYRSGPVAEMRTLAEVAPQPGGGSRLVYQVWARPANPLGLVAIPAQIGVLSARAFDRAVHRYDQFARRPSFSPANFADGPVTFAEGGRERLATLRETLLQQGAAPAIVAALTETLLKADDLALARLRPYALADAWGMKRRAVLEVCLWAVRAGLLNFQWDVLCPLCRVAKEQTPTLGGLKTKVHCESCNIDFDANFERSVELTFCPNPAIRASENRDFCLGGPQNTPHIVAQQLLKPNEHRALALPLEPGRYRARTLGLRGGQFFQATAEGQASAGFAAHATGWADTEPRLALTPQLELENATSADQLFIIERMTWSDQAVTAAEVITLQLFRDLFASEALRPGEQISVGNLTILFTDLRDSTRMYRQVGDAVAFGRVMSHFDVLKAAITTESGSLVKTIGDSVMAAFIRPVAALRTLLKVQHELANPPAGGTPLQLKAGINYGPCIAVTLNERLDYFGSTVNLAARLEGQSAAGGIVISDSVRNDPEVLAYLASLSDLVRVEPFTTQVKGFDEEHFTLWRVVLTQANQFAKL